MADFNELTFLDNRFVITEDLAKHITTRKPQEKAEFEIKKRYLAIKDKMVEELIQLINPEIEKYIKSIRETIKTLQQASEKGYLDLLSTFENRTLPEIGRRIIFKYTTFDNISVSDVRNELTSYSSAIYSETHTSFVTNVCNDIEKINSMQNSLAELRGLSQQRSTPTYVGYGFGFQGTVNAAVGAAVTNLGMGLLQGFSDEQTALSNETMIQQQKTQSLDRAKRDLIVMGQEDMKKLAEICVKYLFKDMNNEIYALGIKPYRSFSPKELEILKLRNDNYYEAFVEEDITTKCFVEYIFQELQNDPYNKSHYCHLIQAACALEDQSAVERIFAFAGVLGIEQSVKFLLESDTTIKMKQIKNWPENVLAKAERKYSAVSRLYGSEVIPEKNRLKEKIKLLKNLSTIRNNLTKYSGMIAAGYMTLFINPDRTVTAIGKNEDGRLHTRRMKNVVAISVHKDEALALCSDGTIIFDGSIGNWEKDFEKRCSDITSISMGFSHCVVVKRDGTVLADGSYGSSLRDKIKEQNWQNITMVACGEYCVYGVKSDGTVVAVGKIDSFNKIKPKELVSSWTDIIAVSVGEYHVLGLKKDGTVLANGVDTYANEGQLNVKDWWGIVAICAGSEHSVGLRADGTVLACGKNDHGQCDVGNWRNIVAISAGSGYTVGLKADGTMVAVGRNDDCRCNVSQYKLRLN